MAFGGSRKRSENSGFASSWRIGYPLLFATMLEAMKIERATRLAGPKTQRIVDVSEMDCMADQDALKLIGDVIYAENAAILEHAQRHHRRFVHYTSAETAISIISKKEIWLRNSLVMNDYSEIAYGEQLFRNAFYSDSETNKLSKEVLGSISNGLHERVIKYFEEGAARRRLSTYLMSVSEHGPFEIKPGMMADEREARYGRLSMWRAYGRDSVGVALVLNPKALLEPSDALPAITSPVFYCEQFEFDHRYSSMLLRARATLEELRRLPEGWFETNLKRFIDISALTLKHPGFDEEREWRITYSADPDVEHVSDDIFNETSRIKRSFVTLNGIPQRIYKIPFKDYPEDNFTGAEINSLLERVIIGPSQYPAVVADAIIMALRTAGVEQPEQRIYVSNIPLRT